MTTGPETTPDALLSARELERLGDIVRPFVRSPDDFYDLVAALDAYTATRARQAAEGMRAQLADLRAQVELQVEALKPFACAADGIPASKADAAPACHVTADAKAAGTITTLLVADFRRARTALGQQQ